MKILTKIQRLVDIRGLGLPDVEIPKVLEETDVAFRLQVLILLVDQTPVIPTPLPIATGPTPLLLIPAKSWILV